MSFSCLLVLILSITPSPIHAATPDGDLPRLLEDGRKALESGDTSGALEAFEACLELAPDDVDLTCWLAATHLMIARTLIETDGVGAAISAELGDAEMLARHAATLVEATGASGAESSSTAAAPATTDRAHPWRLLLQILRLQGRGDEALEEGRHAVSLGDTRFETLGPLADELIRVHQQTIDEEASRQAANDPSEPAPESAASPRRTAALEEAIALLEQGIEALDRQPPQDPDDTRPLAVRLRETPQAAELSGIARKLGLAHELAGEIPAARHAYQTAVEAAPDDLEAHTDLYNFATRSSDQLDDALTFYRELDSDRQPLVWWFLGQLSVARANKAYNDRKSALALFHYAAARGSFETSAALEPSYASDAGDMITMTRAYAGWALMQMGNTDRAEAQFVQALEEQPGMANAVQGLDQLGGKLYQASSSGEIPLSRVRDFFDQIVRVCPDNVDWWNNLGLFARDTDEFEKAYEAYQHAADLAPDSPRVQNDCALILVHHLHRNLEEAEQRLLTAVRLGREALDAASTEAARSEAYSAYTDALSNIALLYDQMGRLEDSKRFLDELEAVQPGRPDVTVLRARVTRALDGSAGE